MIRPAGTDSYVWRARPADTLALQGAAVILGASALHGAAVPRATADGLGRNRTARLPSGNALVLLAGTRTTSERCGAVFRISENSAAALLLDGMMSHQVKRDEKAE
jgi:hypothetical protein